MKLQKYNGQQLTKSKVIFNEEEHTYTLGDKKLSGITALINKHIYSGEKYANVPEWILERARQVGSLVHSEIEKYYTNGENGFTAELQNFIDQQQQNNFKVLENEFTVTDNENFATNIDLILEWYGLTLCDIKTTSQLDTEYLSWQLSINAYLFEMQTGIKVDRLMAYWTRSNEFVEIKRKDNSEIKKLLQAELDCEIYTKPNETLELIQIDQQNAFIEIQRQIQSQKAMLEQLEQQQEQMKVEIMEAMKQNGIKSFDMGEIKLTYIAPTTRESLDNKTLKVELPEIYEKYKKETQVKEQLKITIRSKK